MHADEASPSAPRKGGGAAVVLRPGSSECLADAASAAAAAAEVEAADAVAAASAAAAAVSASALFRACRSSESAWRCEVRFEIWLEVLDSLPVSEMWVNVNEIVDR